MIALAEKLSMVFLQTSLVCLSAAERLHAWARSRRSGRPAWLDEMLEDIEREERH